MLRVPIFLNRILDRTLKSGEPLITLQIAIKDSTIHLKGHGGAKGMVREIQAALPEYPFAARFDVASYYETINHEALLSLLEKCACPPHLIDVVRQYLTLPDRADTGVGLSAGGSLSPLPGHSTCIHWMPYLLSSPGNSGQT